MTEDQVYQHLLAVIERVGGQRAFAQQIRVTPSYINDVVNKRRLMSDRILAAIGVERVITIEYRRVTNVAPNVAKPDQEQDDTAS